MGFNNPVIGGMSNLIRQAMQSPNFISGQSGWIVRKDGSAEFNNLNVRGTFTGPFFVLNGNGLFLYNQAGSGPTSQRFTAGSGNWTAPAGVTSVDAQCWGADGGGGNGAGGGGGGGEYAEETSLVVTPGNSYAYSVGAGGIGGAAGTNTVHNGAAGGATTMAGDVKTVTAHGGSGGTGGGGSSSGTPAGGAGGSGSTNAIHFNGGNGGKGLGSSGTGGGGGGSAGTGSAGHNGSNGTTGGGGAGGTAVTGGGAGAQGGGAGQDGSSNSLQPGGGGGGGGTTPVNQGNKGGTGSGGQIILTYTPSTTLALVTSDCGQPTADPLLGIQCPAGFTNYATGSQTTQVNTNSAFLSFIDSVNDPQAPGLIGLASVTNTNDALQLNSPAQLASDVQAFLALQKAASGNPAIAKLMNAILNIASTSPTTPTPASGVNFVVDGSHNLNMIGDSTANKHILIFNYDLTLRSAVTPSAPSSGWRITNDANSNLVLTPAASTGQLVELINSGLWLHDNNAALLAPAAGVIAQLDSSGNRVELTDSNNQTFTAAGGRLSTFPNNAVTNATPTNFTSYTIPASDMRVGTQILIEAEGHWTQATGTALPFTIIGGIASLGTIVTQTIGITGFNAGGTGRWVGWVRITCVTTGVTGTVHMSVWLTWTPNANPNNTVVVCDTTGATPVTLNTTITQDLQLRANWSSNAGSPNATCRVATVERKN